MEKYIKSDAVLNFINGCLEHEDKITDIEKAVLIGVKTYVERIPSADIVEVRHGKWHMFLKGSSSYNGVQVLSDAFQCTICKESFWNKSNYCPNCGAKMDGGAKND